MTAETMRRRGPDGSKLGRQWLIEIGVVVKGLRAVTDFDAELQMAQMNHKMSGVETFFVAANPEWSYLSSSLIREVVRYGGDIGGLVPEFVADRLAEKLAPGKE